MFRNRTRRRGVSLLELLVVITLMGIFASVAAMRFGRTLLSEFGAHAEARQLSLALLTCQRAAVKTGDDHLLRFVLEGGRAASYQLLRDNAGTLQLVDGPRALSGDITVTVSHPDMRFDFEGSAQAAYQIQLLGENRRWQIDVVPVTGAIRVTDAS